MKRNKGTVINSCVHLCNYNTIPTLKTCIEYSAIKDMNIYGLTIKETKAFPRSRGDCLVKRDWMEC